MRISNKFIISCIAASCLTTISIAGENITISDTHAGSSALTLNSDDNLTITSKGEVMVFNTDDINAIYSNHFNANILNNGTIYASASYDDSYKYAGGIKNEVLEKNGTIVNNGKINISGNGNSAAINISTLDGVVINRGDLTMSYKGYGIKINNGSGTIINDTNGTIYAQVGIFVNRSSSVNILNKGKIKHKPVNFGDAGIVVNDTFSGSIVNDTTGLIEYGIKALDKLDGTIYNYGTITQNSLTYKGIAIPTLNGKIVNEEGGVIGGDYAVYVDSVNSEGSIVNNGTMENNAQSSIYVKHLNGTVTNNGLISDCVAVSVEDGGGTILNGKNGRIINTASTSIYTENFDGYFINEGLVDSYDLKLDSANLVNKGVLSLHGGVTDVGSYTQNVNAILKMSLLIDKYDSSAGSLAGDIYTKYPHIVSKGSIDLPEYSTIFIDVKGNGLENQWKEQNGTLSDVFVSQNGTINVNVDTLNFLDNSAILYFMALLSDDKKSLDITVQEKYIKNILLASGSSYADVGGVLDDLGGSDSDINRFLSKLKVLATDKEVVDAVAGTAPTLTTSMAMLNTQIVSTVSSVVGMRQSSLRGLNSGDKAFTNRYMWFKPYGSYTKQKDKDGLFGFDANTYGFGVGMDGEYSSSKRLGIAFFYTNADVDTNNINQSSKLDVYTTVIYGSKPIYDSKTLFSYQAGIAIQKTKTSREVLGTGTATAKFTSKNFFAQTKFTKNYSYSDHLSLNPSVKFIYSYFTNPSYSESGVGGMGLNVNGFHKSNFIVGIGNDFVYRFKNGMKLISSFVINYNTNNNSQIVSASYQGSGGVYFDTNGIKNSAVEYKAGIGLVKKVKKDVTFDINYNFRGRGDDFQNHSVYAKLRWKF